MDKIMRDLGCEVLDEKASTIFERVKNYNVEKEYDKNTRYYVRNLNFLNKVKINYKDGKDTTKETINSLQVITFEGMDEKTIFVIKFKTESGKIIDLKLLYLSDVNKIINSL